MAPGTRVAAGPSHCAPSNPPSRARRVSARQAPCMPRSRGVRTRVFSRLELLLHLHAVQGVAHALQETIVKKGIRVQELRG